MPAALLSADDLQRLVLLYLSVAHDTDKNFVSTEHDTILRIVHRWVPSMTIDEINDVVDAAHEAIRNGTAETPETLARAVGTNLTPEMRRRVLSNLGQVARADGYLSLSEARVIRRVRAALETVGADR
jgi:uncharacterized tellurite resistance protein B-like protein